MKNFISSMLGSLVAIVLSGVVLLLICAGLIGAIIAAGSHKGPRLESGSYLVFDLSTNITDAPASIDFGSLLDDHPDTLQLRTVLRALRAAAHDDRIRGVLLLGSFKPAGYGTGFAALREVRGALAEVRAAGKPVRAYLDFATTRDYYVASVADRIDLNPYGIVVMPGLATEPMFFAGAFEKYGIGIQVTRVGKYKSFVEPYIRKDMSPENREQLGLLLGDLWHSLLSDISLSRHTSVDALQATVDAQGLIQADAALKAHLVDRLSYRDVVVDELRAQTGVSDPKSDFLQIGLPEYAKVGLDSAEPTRRGERVAVVYAEGDIVEGEGQAGQVGGVRFARELRRLREDSGVKAIVLRVNSPGGSASAAEDIQREIRLTRATKPVIVSMGGYAASGGYWISAYADRIFAEPTTITGSIGVFGIQFDIQKLANGFGITFDSVKTGRFADTLTISRPKTPEELALFQRLVDWIYGRFIAKVAEGRSLKPDFVESIAQGRVWSGTEARKLGLVDEMGGLTAAIAYAGRRAGLGAHFRVSEYPATKEIPEAIAEMLGKAEPDGLRAAAAAVTNTRPRGVLGSIESKLEVELSRLAAYNDSAGVYARLPIELDLK